MRTANIHEAKTQLSRLVEAALAGEEVVIARNGVPAVKLVPVEKPAVRRRGGMWKGEIVEHDPDWWKPDPEMADLFEHGDPDHPDPLFEPGQPAR
ncbi:type II toxin-antitoxin system Phd/YefM family antitoxin [Enterovirga rhinocerotis]|uniref:Antitoxin n=1 Tax=Enterovirga rhinocerotis TaxID=1339210 RepID=A0A4V3DXB0_9HYPH|nr:type II toxin-antitoxin system prevent-host-death family antitoxin [Enterovirga rhinocerotis]TDR88009.1 prevent-host-death family protein [Enterovirga rhinocerotis]